MLRRLLRCLRPSYIRSWGRRESGPARRRRRWWSAGACCVASLLRPFCAFRRCRLLPAVLLQQLLRRVVLGGDLQPLDGLLALAVQLVEVVLRAGDAVFEELVRADADSVDSANVSAPCVCLQIWRSNVHDRPSEDGGILNDAPVVPSQDEGEDDGVEEVREGGVEGPESLEAAGLLAVGVEAVGCLCDPGREAGQRLLKGRGGVVLALGLVSMAQSLSGGTLRRKQDAHLEGPEGHHDAGVRASLPQAHGESSRRGGSPWDRRIVVCLLWRHHRRSSWAAEARARDDTARRAPGTPVSELHQLLRLHRFHGQRALYRLCALIYDQIRGQVLCTSLVLARGPLRPASTPRPRLLSS